LNTPVCRRFTRVIDEIHALLAGTFREQRVVLNAIRYLANDLRIRDTRERPTGRTDPSVSASR
jgi:hypothetical protein